MRKLYALVVARTKEFYRDRAALIWSLAFPFIVLAGFAYGYSGKQEPILRVVVTPVAAMANPVAKTLAATPGLDVHGTDDSSGALRRIEHFETDLLLSFPNGAPATYSFNRDSDKGKLAEKLLAEAAAAQPEPRPALEAREVSGRKLRYADWLLPGLLAMNIMFGSMFGVGYVIVRYRKNGVLKRLRATPLSAFTFLAAQIVSRMLLMIITSFMVLGGAMVLIGFKPQGSMLDLAAFIAVSSAAMIALSLIIAGRISTEEVAEGLLNIMTWPMIFLSGIWFSIEGASTWVRLTAKAMPLTPVVDGLRAILLEGAGLGQIYPQILTLLVLSAVFVAIGSAIFRWR